MGTTCRIGNWWYLSTQWKGNLLVDLQIKAEVVDEEVDSNELAVKQVTFHEYHLLVWWGAGRGRVGAGGAHGAAALHLADGQV